MGLRTGRRLLAFGALGFGLGLTPSGAGAQWGRPAPPAVPSGITAPGATGGFGIYANPYMNPYLNPFMNPYAAVQTPGDGRNAALYFLSAQKMKGGLGSGRLGGPNAANPAATKPAAVGDDDGSRGGNANVPGGSAARFFNRGPVTAPTANRYYNRPARYFPKNGR